MSALAARPRIRARLLYADADPSFAEHLDRHGELPHIGRSLLEEVEESGLTGRGGAGFPTAVKLRNRAHAVIANGTEGEPLSAKDAVLLARNPHLVIDGVLVAARLVGARSATIAVSGPHVELERALAERHRSERPALVRVPHRFVAGEETALVSAVRGGPALPTGRRPYEDGVLVQNVETLAQLALVARYGATWFREAGTAAEPGTALATVSGAVRTPGVIEIELGTTLGEVLDRCGGPTAELQAVLVGGYFGSWLAADPALVLSRESILSLGARVILALPESACGLAETARIAAYMAEQSAGQCGPCVFGLPALAAELAKPLPSLDRIARLDAQIARRGACAHPDGTLGMVRSALATFEDELHLHAEGRCSAR
jgi:NADH:ubiquinone oxidoreductase subunit F (NADH-binding)